MTDLTADEAPLVFPRRWLRAGVAWWVVGTAAATAAIVLVPGTFPYMPKVVLAAGLYTIPGLGVSRLLVRRSYPSERALWWPWLYGLRCFFVWGYGVAWVFIAQWLARYPAGSAAWRVGGVVAAAFGLAALVLWGAVMADTLRNGLGGRDRSELVVDAVLVLLVLTGPVAVMIHSVDPGVTRLLPGIVGVVEPLSACFGLAAMGWWGAWLVRLLRRSAGLRAISVDVIDLVAVAVAAGAVPVAAVLPAVARHGRQLWLTLPLLPIEAALPGLLCAAVMVAARRSAGASDRRGRRPHWDDAWSVVLVVFVTGAGLMAQLAMVLSDFRLPQAPLFVPQAAAFGLFLVRPLAERRRPMVGLEALAPEDQVRRWDLVPALVALVAAGLVVALVAGAASPDGERVAVVVLGLLVVLAAARHRAGVAEARRMHRRIRTMADELYRQARVDPLTGLANRRALAERFPQLAASCERASRPLSVAMVDLDHFKAFNDQHGHLAGDQLLREVAGTLLGVLRHEDVAARYGGEEFCLVLPGADPGQVAGLLDRLRGVRAAADRVGRGGSGTTFSAGVARWRPGEAFDAVVGRADAACYAAKARGRDRIVIGAAESAPVV